jgi:hypothetical protein
VHKRLTSLFASTQRSPSLVSLCPPSFFYARARVRSTVEEIPTASELIRILGLFVVLLLSFAIRLPNLHVPLDRDEGGFATIATGWSQGQLPYRDLVDNKPPLVFITYRLALKAFGSRPEAVRYGLLVLALLQIWVFYKIARRWLENETSALAATLIFSLLSAEPTYGVGTALNAGAIAMLPLLIAVWFLPISALWAGVFAGAAIMSRQTMAVPALAFAGVMIIQDPKSLRSILAYGIGLLFIPTAFLTYFAVHGAAHEFVYQVFTYNLSHTAGVAQSGRLLEGLRGLVDNIQALAPGEALVWTLAVLGCAAAVTQARSRALFLLAWLLASIASVCVSFRFLSHYFLDLAPVLALAAGFGFAWLYQRSNRIRAIAFCGLAIAMVLFGWSNRLFLFSGSPEAISREIYTGNYFVEAERVAQYLRETTALSDRILVFGSEPEILFGAQRSSATRFVFFYPLTLEPASPQAQASARQMQETLVREVESNFPERIVWVNNPLSFLAGPKTDTLILEKGREWLKSGRYEFEGAVFAPAGENPRYLLGSKFAANIDPQTIKQAVYVLYRLNKASPEAHGN